MMGFLVAGLLASFALANSAGLARAALRRDRPEALSLSVTTLALSVGTLTQVMFWLAVARPGHLDLVSTLGATLVISAAGVVLALRFPSGRPWPGTAAGVFRTPRGASALIPFAVVAACGAILFGAAWWPFSIGDALAVYGPLSRGIVASGALPIGEGFYEAYPMLVPMLFAFAEWISGGPNEYLSRFLTALLAVGAVAGACWLARELRSARAGWLAAALLVSSPAFCRWAISGYADIPAGFFLAVAAVFAWRWWCRRDLVDALLGGTSAGLAIWAKNSLLTLLVSAPLLLAAWWWTDRARLRSLGRGAPPESPVTPWHWTPVAAAGLVAALVGVPFYVRNLIVFGFIVPPGVRTVWSVHAQHDVASLLIPLDPRRFGLLGLAGAALLVVTVGRIVFRNGRAPAEALFASLALPFLAAWWWFASYDPRFLVTLLPVSAGFAGGLLDEGLERLVRTRDGWTKPAEAVVVAALFVSILFAARQAVEHKRDVLFHPLMNDLARHRVQVGGLFELGQAVERLPVTARISGVPAMARYYLDPSRLAHVAWAGPDPGPRAGFDYEVRVSPAVGAPEDSRDDGPLVFRTTDGYTLREAQR